MNTEPVKALAVVEPPRITIRDVWHSLESNTRDAVSAIGFIFGVMAAAGLVLVVGTWPIPTLLAATSAGLGYVCSVFALGYRKLRGRNEY